MRDRWAGFLRTLPTVARGGHLAALYSNVSYASAANTPARQIHGKYSPVSHNGIRTSSGWGGLNFKDDQWKDLHHKDKTIMWPSYLYHRNPTPEKTVFIFQTLNNGQIICRFSNALSWNTKLLSKISLKFVSRVHLTQHWFSWWLGTKQATSHYLSKSWPNSLTHWSITRPLWVSLPKDYDAQWC